MKNVFTPTAYFQSPECRRTQRLLSRIILIAMLVILAIALLPMLTGCTSMTVTNTKTPQPDGTVVEQIITERSGLFIEKTAAFASGLGGIKVESTGGATSSTAMPNVIIANQNMAAGVSAAGENKPVAGYSEGTSLLSQLFSLSAKNVSWFYIGTEGETAAETAARVKELKGLCTQSSQSTANADK